MSRMGRWLALSALLILPLPDPCLNFKFERRQLDDPSVLPSVYEPSTVTDFQTATLVPGEKLNFSCMTSEEDSTPAIRNWKWRHIGAQKFRELGHDDPAVDFTGISLTIYPARPDHAGDYQCRVKRNHSSDYFRFYEVQIKLRERPSIDDLYHVHDSTNDSITLTVGDRLDVTCHVFKHNQPVMQVEWLYSRTSSDNKQMFLLRDQNVCAGGCWPPASYSTKLTQGVLTRYHIEEKNSSPVMIERVDTYTKQLVIDPINLGNMGYYACTADNEITEKASKVIFVRVEEKVPFPWSYLIIPIVTFLVSLLLYCLYDKIRAYRELQVINQRLEDIYKSRASIA